MYDERVHGVPVASTFWFGAMCGALALAFRIYYDQKEKRSALASAVVGVASSLVLMTAPFSCIYVPTVVILGMRAIVALIVFRALLVFLVARDVLASWTRVRVTIGAKETVAFVSCIAYLISIVAVAFAFSSEPQKRSGPGQPYHSSSCDVLEPSFFGLFHRRKYVCDAGIVPSRDLYASVKADFSGGKLWSTIRAVNFVEDERKSCLQLVLSRSCIGAALATYSFVVRLGDDRKRKDV